jgi:hypothetical protein
MTGEAVTAPSADVSPKAAKVTKPKRTPARKSGATPKTALAATPSAKDEVKKPARRRGLGLGGAWKLPGIDGYMPPPALDESVEHVRLELRL